MRRRRYRWHTDSRQIAALVAKIWTHRSDRDVSSVEDGSSAPPKSSDTHGDCCRLAQPPGLLHRQGDRHMQLVRGDEVPVITRRSRTRSALIHGIDLLAGNHSKTG